MAFITTSWSCLLLLMGAALVASAPSSHSYSSSARSFHNLMEPKPFDGHGTFRNTPEAENTETVGETEVSEEAVRVTNIPEEAVEESYKAPEDQFFNTDHKDEQSQAPEEEDQYEEPQDGHLKDSEDDHSEEPEDEEDQNKEHEHEDPVDDRSENDDLEDSEEDHSEESEEEEQSEEFEDEDDHSEESEEEEHSEEFEDEDDLSELSRMVLFVGYPVGESTGRQHHQNHHGNNFGIPIANHNHYRPPYIHSHPLLHVSNNPYNPGAYLTPSFPHLHQG